MPGPPTQEQLDATVDWVSRQFSHYYANHNVAMPSRYGRREFGFLWLGKKFFLRHTAFTSSDALRDFLVREAPHHAYYSTAYYKMPHASTMAEKEWLGADLIFDLDADHLPNADKLSFAEQIGAVKIQAKKLLDDYLLRDFGFDEQHIRIVFSGGRGYHFHVTDPRVLQLDSAARREIVDYISPNTEVASHLFSDWVEEKAVGKGFQGRTQYDKRIAPADSPGWKGRITRSVIAFLEETMSQPRGIAIKRLSDLPGIGKKTAEELLDKLTPEVLNRIAKTGHLIPALSREAVITALIEEAKIRAPGETDEPVTADIKRLIRLPGTLHGKTGLRVTPLTVEEFNRFDPLRDAVPWDDAPTRILVTKSVDVPLCGKHIRLEPGTQEVPHYAAVFATLRRCALQPPVGAP